VKIVRKTLVLGLLGLVFLGLLALPALGAPLWKNQEQYVRGILIIVDGKGYYLAGESLGGGASDVPGHWWRMAKPNMIVGLHYNTGPLGSPFEAKGWSSDAPDSALLYVVEGIIDTWSAGKAKKYARLGFVHYHELVSASDGTFHPRKVVWLKHTAVISFTLDGGPASWTPTPPDPIPYEHWVEPGVDYLFPNNYMNPYEP
jgi:hypothetical protein